MALESAFQVNQNGISLDDNALIASTSVNPKISPGYPAPVGSVLFYAGNFYRKNSASDIDWKIMLDEANFNSQSVKNIFYRQNSLSPNVIEWNDIKYSANSFFTFNPTLNNTSTGTAIFTTIYSVQLTLFKNSTVITNFHKGMTTTISPNNKIISTRAAKVDRSTQVALGTADGWTDTSNSINATMHCKIIGI